MCKIIMPSIIFSILRVVFAQYCAFQGDWSGGDGVLGPVWEWYTEYYQSSCINSSGYPGYLHLEGILEFTIDEEFEYVNSIYPVDIDGDGDMDVLGSAYGDDEIAWWENVDEELGITWTKHSIDNDFDGARSVYSADINADGYMDVLGASWIDGDITWWESIDGSGINWTEHIIDGEFTYAESAYPADVDGDGDLDVLGAAYWTNLIVWWENVDGIGTTWIEHTIDEDFECAISIHSEDMDNDNDMDVLGAACADGLVSWWENVDGIGTTWTEHTIAVDFDGVRSVYSKDIDGDGDMDALGAANSDAFIKWWENANGVGTSWIEHTIDSDYDGAKFAYATDFNGDGYLDILAAVYYWYDGEITWWENVDGSGTSWIKHIVGQNLDYPSSVYAADVDGDSDLDVIGAVFKDNEIIWWKLDPYSSLGTLESSILHIPWQTDDSIEWGNISWEGTEPPATEISFLVRASDNPSNMGPWSDTLTVSGTNLSGILGEYDNNLQYKVIFETSDPYTTPILDEITVEWIYLGIGNMSEQVPMVTNLFPILPNPSSGSPIIRFALPETANVDIYVFDFSGRLVSEIHGDEYSIGFHEVLLGDFSPGIYFCRMISGEFAATQRFVVIE